MNRLDHLQKAETLIGQAIANIQYAEVWGTDHLVELLRNAERLTLDLQDKEPHGDPDPYETAKELQA
jgi:hypothetical protein